MGATKSAPAMKAPAKASSRFGFFTCVIAVQRNNTTIHEIGIGIGIGFGSGNGIGISIGISIGIGIGVKIGIGIDIGVGIVNR